MTKRLSIVGFCGDSRDWTPYEDPDMAVWGLNRGYIFMQRFDRWFEMHGGNITHNVNRRPSGHMTWLGKFPGPVYMHKATEEVPTSVTYPLKEVAEVVAGTVYRVNDKGEQTSAADAPYLTSSIAQEIALAITEGYEEIHLYGIDLNTDSEYAWQKPGVEYMLGVAVGRGIKVVLPDNCPLLKGNIYGRGYLSPEGERMSLAQLESRAKALQHEQSEVARQLHELAGAKRELEFVQAQIIPGLDHEQLDQRRQKMVATLEQLQGRLLHIQGGMKETAYWIHQTPNGQDPREAIAQMHDAEGPVTELDQLLYEEDPAGKAAEPAPVGEFEPAIV